MRRLTSASVGSSGLEKCCGGRRPASVEVEDTFFHAPPQCFPSSGLPTLLSNWRFSSGRPNLRISLVCITGTVQKSQGYDVCFRTIPPLSWRPMRPNLGSIGVFMLRGEFSSYSTIIQYILLHTFHFQAGRTLPNGELRGSFRSDMVLYRSVD
jgi:hypothetical protein